MYQSDAVEPLLSDLAGLSTLIIVDEFIRAVSSLFKCHPHCSILSLEIFRLRNRIP